MAHGASIILYLNDMEIDACIVMSIVYVYMIYMCKLCIITPRGLLTSFATSNPATQGAQNELTETP